MTNKIQKNHDRLIGLDLARFLALVGMVIVNFDVVMVSSELVDQFSVAIFFQGKAAAIFVVLAGIAFGLYATNKNSFASYKLTTKRFVFLFVLGMLNTIIFQADIIHYYAFYFLFGMFFLRAKHVTILITISLIFTSSFAALLLIDYGKGWDWSTYSYLDFWQLNGFIRNLFFNGWHPIFPWFSFFLFGLLFSRMNLSDRKTQWQFLVYGFVIFVGASMVSQHLVNYVSLIDPEASVLFHDDPIPPGPFYLLVGASFATMLIGACLVLQGLLIKIKLITLFTTAGKQTLTLYIAHIIIGMGWLEYTNMLGNQTRNTSLLASLIFILIAIFYTTIWSRYFNRGPLEILMRKVCG